MKKFMGFALILGIAVSSAIAGTVVDKDGNKYKTVKIGKQHWMGEDYRFESKHSVCMHYNDDSDNCIRKYDFDLGNWNLREVESLCPTGWRLPEPEDIRMLRLFLEPNYSDDMTQKQKRHADLRISNKLRSKLWNDGEDAFGFNALPNACFGRCEGYDGDYAGYLALRPIAGIYGPTKEIVEFGIFKEGFGAFKRTARASTYYHIRCIEDSSR